MRENSEFGINDKIKTYDFPYQLENPEAIELIRELLTDKKISEHLNFLKEHHLPSYEHSLRVGTLSADLCLENGLEPHETNLIGSGGLLHDLGKCFIPIEILSKNSPLTKEEMEIMHLHARKGFENLKDPAFNGVREIVVAHHEFRIENPYPRNFKEFEKTEKIQPTRRNGEKRNYERAAIVAVADIFDALSSHRPYNPEFSYKEIEEKIRHEFTGDHKLIDQILKRSDLDK